MCDLLSPSPRNPVPTAPPTINLPIKSEIENPSVNDADEIEVDAVQAMLDFATHEV